MRLVMPINLQEVVRGKRGLEYFEALHSQEGRKFAPLETASIILEHLGNPQNKIKAIHVAGTNGKGTVCSLLSAMLIAKGFSVGQSSSPHLMDVTERCLINGRPNSSEEFGEAIEKIVDICERENLLPSYFVLGVVACFYEFARLNLDWMVIEVGLGGELDATNLMLKPEATVITNISLDHTEILGQTAVEISRSKAGIAKAGVPMFVGKVETAVASEIEKICLQHAALVNLWGRDFSYDPVNSKLKTKQGEYSLILEKLFLEGKYQKDNAILAAAVMSALGLEEKFINNGIASARWPGRLEYFYNILNSKSDLLLDVAHNPGGMEVLKEYLLEKIPGNWNKIVLIISILKRKDWPTMLTQLKGLKKELLEKNVTVDFVFTSSGHVSALEPEIMQEFLAEGNIASTVESVLPEVLENISSRTLVVVTGSLFLVGKIREDVCREFVSYQKSS